MAGLSFRTAASQRLQSSRAEAVGIHDADSVAILAQVILWLGNLRPTVVWRTTAEARRAATAAALLALVLAAPQLF